MPLLKSTFILVAILALKISLYGQIPTGSSATSIPTEVEVADVRAQQVIARAEDHYKKGKVNLDDNRREQARDEFDKAVDVILESGMDVRANQRLQIYYLQLVERIYKLEFPNRIYTRPLPPAGLLTDNVVPVTPRVGSQVKDPRVPQVGFREQQFEPSPLDELSKLVITNEEQNIRPADLTPTPPNPSCPLKITQSPDIRGFRLGMSIDDVRKRLTGVKAYFSNVERPNDVGFMRVAFSPVASSNRQSNKLEGIEKVTLEFLDGRVTAIQMDYDSSVKWRGVEEFIERVSEALKLPKAWGRADGISESDPLIQYRITPRERALYCDGFAIKAKVLVGAQLHLFDQSTAIKIDRRKASIEEKRRQTFKP